MMRLLHDLLQEQPLFTGLAPSELEFLAGCSQLMRFGADEPVFREGDVADRCYLVRSGSVVVGMHLPDRGWVGLATVEPGELLGWSWLFPPGRWRLDAMAQTSCSLFAFDASCLVGKLDEHPHLGYVLMTRLARVASEHLLEARHQLLDFYHSPSDGERSLGVGVTSP